MAKKTEGEAKKTDAEAKRAHLDVSSLPEANVTLTTRLTAEQKELIDQAAQLQSWTPSSLVRKAAVERAAHIINTARPTKFAFGSIAERIAQQLAAPELWLEGREAPTLVDGPVYEDDEEIVAARLSAREFEQFFDAVYLGGVEFMNQVVDACQRRRDESALPSPIDPATFE